MKEGEVRDLFDYEFTHTIEKMVEEKLEEMKHSMESKMALQTHALLQQFVLNVEGKIKERIKETFAYPNATMPLSIVRESLCAASLDLHNCYLQHLRRKESPAMTPEKNVSTARLDKDSAASLLSDIHQALSEDAHLWAKNPILLHQSIHMYNAFVRTILLTMGHVTWRGSSLQEKLKQEDIVLYYPNSDDTEQIATLGAKVSALQTIIAELLTLCHADLLTL